MGFSRRRRVRSGGTARRDRGCAVRVRPPRRRRLIIALPAGDHPAGPFPSREDPTVTHYGTGMAPAALGRVYPEQISRRGRRLDMRTRRYGIARRRAQLAELEAAVVAACENAAPRAAARGVRIVDHAT